LLQEYVHIEEQDLETFFIVIVEKNIEKMGHSMQEDFW
jgi:hypothetical protein